MVRTVLALSLLALSTACAAPPSGGSAAATPAPANPPATPAPPAKPKVTYSQCYVDGPFIAITFDDGPHGEHTPRLLDMLKQRGVKATFFVVGQCAAEYPDIMKRIAADGHELANHSWSHPQLTRLGEGSVSDQLQRTHDVITQTTGEVAKLMRPPYGAFTQNQSAWANHKWGYKVILWDVDPLDWKYRNAERVKNEILNRTVNGSIILAHDIHKSTVDAMPGTLDGLLAKGFKFVTVSELLAMDRPAPPKPRATPAPATPVAAGESAPKTTGAATPRPPVAAKAARK